MILEKHDLESLCDLAEGAAKNAGAYISEQANSSLIVERKKGGDSEASQVVTAVDRQAQEIILDSLESTFNKYNFGLLTEESEDDNSRFSKDHFWCIDPLDGTLPFIESSPGYSVSIALVSQKGQSLLGVVFDPVTKKLYKAAVNEGAFINNLRINLRSNPEKQRLTMFSDRSFLNHPQFDQIMEGIEEISNRLGYKESHLIKHGGGALNACWILEQESAVYFKFPKAVAGGGSIWDYAASTCIISQAGGSVSDINGNQLDLNRNDSTFMNHGGILYASDAVLAKAIMELYQNLSN